MISNTYSRRPRWEVAWLPEHHEFENSSSAVGPTRQSHRRQYSCARWACPAAREKSHCANSEPCDGCAVCSVDVATTPGMCVSGFFGIAILLVRGCRLAPSLLFWLLRPRELDFLVDARALLSRRCPRLSSKIVKWRGLREYVFEIMNSS